MLRTRSKRRPRFIPTIIRGPQTAGVDPERITKIRRVLGYLVVDLQSAAIDEAKRARPWIAADTLYGLSEITAHR
jgi:hypothetical protein